VFDMRNMHSIGNVTGSIDELIELKLKSN